MGILRFGRQDEVRCIVDIPAKGPKDEALCLAYKTTSYWLGGGVYLSDGGYVLKPTGQDRVYYNLPADAANGTVEGVPHPLPPYEIPFVDYALGYSLWFAIAVTAAWGGTAKVLKDRRRAAFATTLATTPLSHGPPKLETEGDRFIDAQVRPFLAPGEQIQHQAYTVGWDFANDMAGSAEAFFVVLTTARLFLVTTQVGAFGILWENAKVEAIERAAIAHAVMDDGTLFVTTADGLQRGYVVKPSKKLSNQTAFLQNVGRLLSR